MELTISPNFTVDDIRKVRDYEYEMTKNMTLAEEFISVSDTLDFSSNPASY